MRANPADYELVAPANLTAALEMLAAAPGEWMPIAGGTELMVQLAAGRLQNRKLMSIWNLDGLRQIEVTQEAVIVGSSSTYTDLRNHAILCEEFPLLARSASWTGSIANQNRGTLGGNIANASPAADSPPALLVYQAQLELISVRGSRTVPYADFHTGYKQMNIAPDELLKSISLPRTSAGYFQYSRKVGPRNAQAISKVALAAVGRLKDGLIEDVRVAAASLAHAPLRCRRVEDVLFGAPLDNISIQQAREAIASEIRPIDDIRSTAEYRVAIAANLLEEFLSNWKASS